MQYGLKCILDRNGRIAQMRAAATDGVAWCVGQSACCVLVTHDREHSRDG